MVTVEVGQHVEWSRQAQVTTGVVVEVPKTVDYNADQLMGREPGESVRQFGRLAAVRCTDLTCQCNLTDWTHSVDESQLRAPSEAVIEVALW